MKSEIVAAPAFHPVSLAQVKSHLRETGSGQDTLLTDIIIPAAHRDAVTQLNRSLMPTTWLLTLDRFPCGAWQELLWPRIRSVAWVKYRDAASVLQTLDTALYGVDLAQGRMYLKTGAAWPVTDGLSGAVQVQYESGYVASADNNEAAQQAAVPAEIKQWILIRCGTLYKFREQLLAGMKPEEVPFVTGLLDGEREWNV